MVKEVLESPLSPDWFTTPMMQEHAGVIQNQIEKLQTIGLVLTDPVNAPFFEQLSEVERGSLYIQTRNAVYYERTFEQFLGAHAIAYKTGDYLPYSQGHINNIKASSFSRDLTSLKKEINKGSREKYEIMKDNAATELMNEADRRKERYDENNVEWANLGLTSYINEYSIDSLAKCRKIIEQHPEKYEENKKLVNKIYEDDYRTVDLLGDYILRSQSATIAVNHFSGKNPDRLSYEERMIQIFSEKENDAVSNELEILQKRILTCTDSLSYLLEGAKLSQAADFYLEKMKKC